MKTRFPFLILAALFLMSFNLTGQTATNVDVSTSNDKMIITYDLGGMKDEVYNVKLLFKKEDGTIIEPKSIKGDYGKVISGEGKAVIWEVYKDLDELSGKIEPELVINEIAIKKPKTTVQPTPKPPAPTVDPNQKKSRSNNKNGNNNGPKIADVIDNLFKKYRFGFKVGIGNSRVESNRRPNDFNEGFSYEVGTFFRWNPMRRVYLQSEILYHQHLYEEDLSAVTMSSGSLSENRNHYARAQVIGGVAPLGAGIHFNAGLYYGRLLGGKEKVTLDDITSETTHFSVAPRNGIETPYKANDAGFIIGGTMSFFKGSFALGVLYSRGFDSYIDPDYYVADLNYENWKKVNESFHFYIAKSF